MPCPLLLCQGYNIDVAFLLFKGTESDGAEDVDTVEMRVQWFKGMEIRINEWLNSCGNEFWTHVLALRFTTMRTEPPHLTIIHVSTHTHQHLSLFQVIIIVQFVRNSRSPNQLYDRIFFFNDTAATE